MSAVSLVLIIANPVQADSIELGVGAIQDQNNDAVAMVQGAWLSRQYPELGGVQFQAGAFLAEQETLYLHGGIARTWELPGRWAWGAGLSVGVYHTNGPELELGHDLELMTRIYLDYELSVDQSVRLEAGHLSNGGLDDHNPGTEYLQFKWLFRY